MDGIRKTAHLAQIADHQFLQTRGAEQRVHLRIQRRQIERDDDIGLAIVDLVRQHLFRVERRVIDHGAAGFQHTEKTDHVVRSVGQVEPDMHTRLDPQLLESLGGAVSQLFQFTVAYFASHEIQRRMIGPFRRRIIQNLRHRHHGKFCIPAYAGRVRFYPGKFSHVRYLENVKGRSCYDHTTVKPPSTAS